MPKIYTDGDKHLFDPNAEKEVLKWHNLRYLTTRHTDGGALKHHLDYQIAINMLAPNKKWKRCLDWCCGDGGLGLMFWGEGWVKDELVFMDRYEPAVMNVKRNILLNSLQEKAKVIKLDKISNLNEGKFDLVIGKPPGARLCNLDRMYDLAWLTRKTTPMLYTEAIKDREEKNPHRAFDWGWESHIEFIENIDKHLEPGADIFLFQNPKQFNPLFWEWGKFPKGLEIYQWVDQNQIPSLQKHHQVILHLKYNV